MKVWLQMYGDSREGSMYSQPEFLDVKAYQLENPSVI
jgi:hypothetical protein